MTRTRPTAKLDVLADLGVRLGAAHLRVRGSGGVVDIHLPAPWHWPRLWRARAGFLPWGRRLLRVARFADVLVRFRYGPLALTAERVV